MKGIQRLGKQGLKFEGSRLTKLGSISNQFVRSLSINVVLLKDLEDKGQQGEEIAVSRGYARNFLIPSKAAVYATHGNRKRFKTVESVEIEEEHHSLTKIQRRAQRLSTKTLNMKRHSVDGVKLHAPVTRENVSEKLQKFFNLTLPVENIELPNNAEQLNSFGQYKVKLVLDKTIGEASHAEINLDLARR